VPVGEEGHVRLGLNEADGGQVGGEATVPAPRRLLEAVQGAVQPTNQIRTSGVNEVGGLAAVDSLRESAVEEGILDVELMDRQVPRAGEGEDDSNGDELDDEAEGLVVVHSGPLGETPKDPTGFVAVEGDVRGQLVAKEPLAGDQVPGVVSHQGRVLLLHSAMPVGVGKGSANGGGDRGGVRRSGSRVSRQDQSVDGAENTDCVTGHHRVDVPGGAVDGDRVVHGRLGAGRRYVRSQGSGPLALVVDGGGVGEANHACRRGRVSRSRGSGPLAAVVDEGGVGEAGHAWRGRGRQSHAWSRATQAGSTGPRMVGCLDRARCGERRERRNHWWRIKIILKE
jgi:hypothetical protein